MPLVLVSAAGRRRGHAAVSLIGTGMPRRALRPSFVVTFAAVGAAAIAGGCSSSTPNNIHGNPPPAPYQFDGSIGDGAIGDGCGNDPGDGLPGEPWCPAEQPCTGAPCDAQPWAMCFYPQGPVCMGYPMGPAAGYTARCGQGQWMVSWSDNCEPLPPVPEAGPDADDAAPDVSDGAPDVSEGGPDVHDAGPDGEGQDGGHD
jgi:hypothetical protein